MRYFYNAQADTFHEAEELPAGMIELDPVKAVMFVHAERMGQRVDRSRLDEFKLDAGLAASQRIENLRSIRNQLLTETDWTQLPDAFGGDAARKGLWSDYRQSLRDMDLEAGVFPQKPQ